MNPKSKVLNLIERTNNLSKPAGKNSTPNTTASSICDTPAKRIKKPASLSISDAQPITFPQSNTSKHSAQSNSSLEFVRNMNFALAEFAANTEKSAKSHKEDYSQDMKVLKYLKGIIREEISLSLNDESPESLVDRNIKLLAQEASQDICSLEKKCGEIQQENEMLRGQVIEFGLYNARDVMDKLKTTNQHIKGHFKELKTAKINHQYGKEIGNTVENWVKNTQLDISPEHLVNYLLKHQLKLEKVSHNLQNTLSLKQSQRKHLEEKLSKANRSN